MVTILPGVSSAGASSNVRYALFVRQPVFVLLHQEHSDEPHTGAGMRKDADDSRAPANLQVLPLQRIG